MRDFSDISLIAYGVKCGDRATQTPLRCIQQNEWSRVSNPFF
jgi:hypothetical protein